MSVGRALGLTLGVLAALAFLWLAWIAAHIAWYRFNPPGETAFMGQRMDDMRE